MVEKIRIAMIDDDVDYAQVLRIQLKKLENTVINHFTSGEAALEAFMRERPPNLVFLDLVMPGLGGMETLKQLRERHPDTQVVMVSSQSTVRVALDAIKLGAKDYLTKGHDDLVKALPLATSISEQIALQQELEGLRSKDVAARHNMIGESKALGDVIHLIERVVRGNLAVAISGESGTGKELVAEAIHAGSDRRDGPFVEVNCAAIPSELMESEFFGHEKGAFTGAQGDREGVFQQASGGTLFLDEIGELDPALQAKLLRTLQDGKLRKVGGSETVEVDVRVISATNRDIQELVSSGTFREDLYYRLFQFPIALPPLRDRGNDVLLLADYFLQDFLGRHQELKPKRMTTDVRRALLDYDWPGNVRQLKTTIERAALLVDGEKIDVVDLALEREVVPHEPHGTKRTETLKGDVVSMDEAKKRALQRAYSDSDGNIEHTAQKLGVTRSTVYRLLRKYKLGPLPGSVLK